MRIAYFPLVTNREQLLDLVSRAAWFLTFSAIEEIRVLVASDQLAATDWAVAPGMDPRISDRFDRLNELVELRTVRSEVELAGAIDGADTILRWDKKELPSWLTDRAMRKLIGDRRIYEVDPARVRYEGSFYIEVGLAQMANREHVIDSSRARFEELATRLGRRERAFALATGPSVERYSEHDFSSAASIACNSVVLDRDLMRAVDPEIVVFADPIFHFGPSQYAGSFRESVLASSEEFGFSICIPLKYHDILLAALPQLADRIIALPYTKDREFNFDLAREFELKVTANVLSYLMLPLAATFSDRIGILGCDGRPRAENTYFWKHNSNTQISDKMENIREVHPAFFSIDYDDYYDEHIETLESQLRAGERRGIEFRCLAPSHIPPLQARSDNPASDNREVNAAVGVRQDHEAEPFGDGGPRVVIIDPDALDWGGHFMAYNEKLTEGLRSRGASVRVLCNTGLEEEILRARNHFVPALTLHTWSVGNTFPPNAGVLVSAEKQLAEGIDRCLDEDGKACLYMYTGSVPHAAMVARTIRRRPGVRASINLFWTSFHSGHWDDWIERYGETIAEINSTPRLTVTVPTEGIRRAIADSTSEVIEVAPHPSTTVSDPMFDRYRAQGAFTAQPERLRVLFPGAARGGKGFSSTLEAVQQLAIDPNLEPIVRYAPHPNVADEEQATRVGKLPENVRVVAGDLDDDEFLELFQNADMCVLPYEPEAFGQRTSGLLIDAVYHGLPVVATTETWLGEFVARFGCGVVIDDTSAERIFAAVKQIAADLAGFRERARDAAEQYFGVNSWSALADSILEVPEETILGPCPRSAAASVDESRVVDRMLAMRSGPENVMLDVGAHHGSSLSHFIARQWRVVACEPDSDNRAALTKKYASAGVTIDARAVSDEPSEEAEFFASSESTGISALHAFRSTHEKSATVAVTTVEELAGAHELARIDFLKIDVEGFDLNVLKGVPWNWLEPEVITCEFDDEKTLRLGYSYQDMADYLVERGYAVYLSEWHPIVAYGISHEWRRLVRYPDPLDSRAAWGNLVSFRQDPGREALRTAFTACVRGGEIDVPPPKSELEEQVAELQQLQRSSGARIARKLAALTEQQLHSRQAIDAQLDELERLIATRDPTRSA